MKPSPTIELTYDLATLRCAGLPPLEFAWPNYPDAFALYMRELQPERVEVTRLRRLETKNEGE